ncbi:MAG TPA: RICIN domain-containing protein [Bacteroidales bacterium]
MKTITNLNLIQKRGIKMLSIFIGLCLSVAVHATVKTYAKLSTLDPSKFSYTLQARDNGTSTWYTVPLYNTVVTNTSGGEVYTNVGNFDCNGSTNIQITFSTTVTSAAIYPASLGITPTISGNTITFTIPGPKKFYVDINGDHYNNCIHVIADSIETDAPSQGDANVIYVPTGTFVDSTITIASGKTLYIQGGAAVRSVNMSSNSKLRGRGFIYRSSYDAIYASWVSNISIEGIIDLNHGWGNGGGCGIRCGSSTNVTIKNTASFSSRKWGDGYDIFCSDTVNINDVFIRTNDDAICFYGGGASSFSGSCKHINVSNSILLPDLAHSFNIGVYGDQNSNTEIRDINVTNIDIINWDRNAEAPMNFMVSDLVRAANIKFQDVRVKDCANLSAPPITAMSIITYSYNPGRAIDSIYFLNVSYTGNSIPASSINGYDANRLVSNVFFNNLKINGNIISGPSAANMTIGTYTNKIKFSSLIAGENYFLTAKHSGKCANVSGGSTTAGAQVVQNTYTSSAYQKWTLEDAANGYFKFKNVNSGLYMDITGGSTSNGATVEQWTSNTGENQQFQLLPQDSGYFTIIARHSGKCLDVNGNSTSEGATIIQWPYTGSNNQLWLLQPALDSATFEVTSKKSGLCLNPKGGSTTAGATIVQNTYTGASYQKWAVKNAGSGFYKLKNVNSGMYMDIYGGFTTDGDSAIQWTSTTGKNQQFYLVSQGSGYYNIICRKSNKCLDVNGGSTSEGATIIQWPGNGGSNQSWLFSLLSTSSSAKITTDIKEGTSEDLKVYPNPVTDMLTISLTGSDLSSAKVEIYNIQGSLVDTQNVFGNVGSIDMSRLSPDIYFVKICDGQRSTLKKIVKQ